MKLFCIHYAGGSAKVFQSLAKLLNNQLEVIPLELPGRGKRLLKELIYDFEKGCQDLISIIKQHLSDKHEEFSLFGHSMGSLLSFELAHLLERQGFSLKHVFLTGTRLPYQYENDSLVDVSKSNAEVIKRIKALGGTPIDVIENPYFAKIYLPIIKADLHMIGSYRYQKAGERLDTPITIINGTEDPLTNNEWDKWSELTSKEVQVITVDGGHFFINEQQEFLAKQICSQLEKYQLVHT
ncbi:thioesterase II family protein [Bacillus bingmayongensis]|uniref:thioesterase II family protein n=1 Tax=Bacillus bingmayongensis TaxID=1150157 RepID=UPI0003026785|nr:alpha/beta fold hydrolase [Bacillus bingmayongensis]MBY0595853.1 alpha/beta fold hydrolase [Bacillus bingmayongensis]